jgi:hypothetical protein
MNHQRSQIGGRILNETVAGFSLGTPSELNARTKKR